MTGPMRAGEREALALASRLAQRAGLPQPEGVTPLPGGRNNRVYRVDGPEGANGPWLLKRYFSHPGDRRDRLGAEFAFLTHAAALGEPQTPRPLARDDEARAALYAFVPGRGLEPGEVRREHVLQALELVARLNVRREAAHALREAAQALPEASEACFSLAQHLGCVAGRVARLAALDPADELDGLALDFVTGRLAPAWEAARQAALTQARPEDDSPLPPQARCISPSDFGFHNALLGPSGRLTFLDFEYAGWDDPAKLVCDFFLQPRVPVPWEFVGEFQDALARVLGARDLSRRVGALFPVYRVKWCCILLGEFLAVSGARRSFSAGGGAPPDARQRQLRLAQALLERPIRIP